MPFSFRSIAIGLGLALLVASSTYFNDWVIRQTFLIATHFPAVIFGTVVLLLLTLGPALRWLGVEPLRPGEIAVIVVLGLAACGFPGSGYWRYHGTLPSMPAHWYKNNPNWKSHRVMSYLPGGSGLLAEGHVRDGGALARAILEAGAAERPSPAGRLWQAADDQGRRAIAAAASAAPPTPEQVRALLGAIDAGLSSRDFFTEESFAGVQLPDDLARRAREDRTTLPPHELTRLNRELLVAALPDLVLPAPPGRHAVVANGQPEPRVVDALLSGRHSDEWFPVTNVPWDLWWPTLRVWGGAALCLSLATLCLSLIVHPQWSRRELLAYPIARFVEEISKPAPGLGVPLVATKPAFWIALLAVFAIHAINGLNVHNPELPRINLTLPFGALRQLFTTASRVSLSPHLFEPRLYFSVVAFSFFLSRSVSLSLGVAHLLYIAVGALMLSAGHTWEYEKTLPTKTGFLRFGAYLGAAAMIIYTGRRYYGNLIVASLGFPRRPDTPNYAVWAARLTPPLIAGAVALLVSAGLAWDLSLILILVLLLSYVVLTRIVCETGAFLVTIPFMPTAVIIGLLGFEAVGPTGLLLIGIASWAFIPDPRETLMPYLSNGLQILDKATGGGRWLPRAAWWQAGVVVGALVVAGVVTMTVQYELGVTRSQDQYSTVFVPSSPFNGLSSAVTEASAAGTLVAATEAAPLSRFAHLDPIPGSGWWVLLGFGLVAVTAAARLRLPWWPIHPVLFLMWGTYANAHFAFSFFLGWLAKTVVVGAGGERAYEASKPLLIGLITGELLAALLWTVVGAIIYLNTGQTPPTYLVYPS